MPIILTALRCSFRKIVAPPPLFNDRYYKIWGSNLSTIETYLKWIIYENPLQHLLITLDYLYIYEMTYGVWVCMCVCVY